MLMHVQYSSKSDWLFNTQSNVLKADWLILKNDEKATLNINMPSSTGQESKAWWFLYVHKCSRSLRLFLSLYNYDGAHRLAEYGILSDRSELSDCIIELFSYIHNSISFIWLVIDYHTQRRSVHSQKYQPVLQPLVKKGWFQIENKTHQDLDCSASFLTQGIWEDFSAYRLKWNGWCVASFKLGCGRCLGTHSTDDLCRFCLLLPHRGKQISWAKNMVQEICVFYWGLLNSHHHGPYFY